MHRILSAMVLFLCCAFARAQQADVSVNVDLFQAMITNGDLAKMQIMVSNNGPDTAENVDFLLEIFKGEYSDIIVTTGESCAIDVFKGRVFCENFGSLAAGESRVVSVKIQLIESEFPTDLLLFADSFSDTEDPNKENNFQEILFEVEALPTGEEFADGMLTGMPENRRERFRRAVNVLAGLCAGENLHSGLSGVCDELFQQALLGDFETITRILDWMQPRNSVHQARNTTELISNQLSNVGQRIAQLRGGVGGLSLSGLNLKSGNQSLPIHLLSYLANDSDDAQSKSPRTVDDPFYSPWGFFVNGNISMGDFSYADEQNDGFDFDSHNITTGIDYRFNSQFVLGMALGYSELESKAGVGSVMDVDGLSASIYGLFTPNDNWFVDARVAFANLDVVQTRKESWQLIDTVFELTAIGETTSKQLTFAVNSGRNFNFGPYLFTPNFGVEYVESTLDEFLEEGAAEFSVFYFEQKFESLKYHLGFDLSRSISLSKGVLSPQFSYRYQYLDQDAGIAELALIDNFFNVDFFEVGTNFLESESHQVSLGLNYVMSKGKQFFLRYRKTLGMRNFDQETINFGIRLEF